MANDTAPDRHLVIGASGVAGAGLVRHLAGSTAQPVFALSRSGRVDPELADRVTGLRADLLDPASVREALRAARPTVIYYAAHRHPGAGQPERALHPATMQTALRLARPFSPLLSRLPGAETWYFGGINQAAGLVDEGQNAAMIGQLLDAVDTLHAEGASDLRHVALLTGGRLSGVHLGPDLWPAYPEPVRADSPRHPGPSWYFAVEDSLWSREPNKTPWTWSIHRPHFILGAAEGMPYSIVNALGAWAVLLREAGLPLVFPGGERAFAARWEAADAELIGAQMVWASQTPAAAGQAWMVGNGPAWRWAEMWPALAQRYGMAWEVPRRAKALSDLVADPERVWAAAREKAKLPPLPLSEAMPLLFLHQSMVVTWDVTYDLAPARALGFGEQRDHRDVVFRLLTQLERRGVLPPA
ncbi:MAG: NAD-dependent epimerase/dehydratase family protein [Deltaproteobacteria bacterium]|nr:NAD-dependent epimerase/dehydratase family protein [Deltaproteobacteria bacterium]